MKSRGEHVHYAEMRMLFAYALSSDSEAEGNIYGKEIFKTKKETAFEKTVKGNNTTGLRIRGSFLYRYM